MVATLSLWVPSTLRFGCMGFQHRLGIDPGVGRFGDFGTGYPSLGNTICCCDTIL